MQFHLGKPILVMILIALTTGAAVLLRPAPRRADLTMWVFAERHAVSYRTPAGSSLADQFAAAKKCSVKIDVASSAAIVLRLGAMFDRREVDPAQPDLVEIEIGSIGRFFAPPLDEVGFLPLDKYLDRDGWRGRLVESRLAPWSKQGVVFGFPHDLHPVSISYRKDLFDQAGIDLAAARTWPQFQEKCLAFQNYWRSRGYPLRHAMELPSASSDYLTVMLMQRGINALDDENRIHLTNPKVAETIAFYAQVVAGPKRIAADATPGGQLWVRDFVNGDLCATMTPDWRAGQLRTQGAAVAGKVAMMPLPRFDPTDAPTASWGGTMAGIPRRCKDPEAAFKLLTFLYSSKQGIDKRWDETMILPPVTDLWTEPVFHQPDEFFSNQMTGELYIDLAKQLPRRYVTPYSALASAHLASILTRAVERVRDGEDNSTLRSEIDGWLREATVDLQRRIDFGTLVRE